MDERKKHGWPFWFAAMAIMLPILYVGGFGPACWIKARTQAPDTTLIPYWPLGVLYQADLMPGWLCWWMDVGVPQGHTLCIPIDPVGNDIIGRNVNHMGDP